MENICIEERKKIVIKGATKVVSATATLAVVELGDTNLSVSGQNLEVVKLDLENKEVVFSGNISALKYSRKTEKTSFLKKLFK